MAAVAKTINKSFPNARGRDHLDIYVSRGKIAFHLIIWLALLALIARVFVLPYFGPIGDKMRDSPNQLVALIGDEVLLAIGLIIASLIVTYITALLVRARVKGPSYRVSKEGLWLYNVKDFFVPGKIIRSVCPIYRQGIMSLLVLEIKDRQALQDLQDRLPRLAGVTCSPDKGTLSIELTGVRNKKNFARTLARVAHSNR